MVALQLQTHHIRTRTLMSHARASTHTSTSSTHGAHGWETLYLRQAHAATSPAHSIETIVVVVAAATTVVIIGGARH